MSGSREDSSVVDAFVQAYLRDLDRGAVRSLSDYQAQFPDHRELIEREYESLMRAAGDATRPVSVDPNLRGRCIGPYQLRRELGRGGQAVVWLAEDTRLHRTVALKLIDLHGDHGGAVSRFHKEAEIASQLDHPGICPIYDLGEESGHAWIAMRFVEGETLAARIQSASLQSVPVLPADDSAHRSEPPGMRSEVLRIARLGELCARALHVAHEAGVVHRDIKPGNIMITAEQAPVILDFGLARNVTEDAQSLTRTGQFVGTPAYMSPEQVVGRPIHLDRRTDIYSLGATLYECLTLRRPFEAATFESLFQAILTKPPGDPRQLNPLLPRDFKTVLDVALEKDRDRRYKTALDLAEDLRRVQQSEPILARPIPPTLRLRRWAGRHPAIATALCGTFVLLLAGLLLAFAVIDRVRAEVAAKDDALQRSRVLGLAAASGEALDVDQSRALLLALEAVGIDRGVPESITALRAALDAQREERERLDGLQGVEHASFVDGGFVAATATSVGFWDLDGSERTALEARSVAAVSGRGDYAWFDDDRVRVLGVDAEITELRLPAAPRLAAFTPTADAIVVLMADGAVAWWSRAGESLRTTRLPRDVQPSLIAALSADGGIVTVSADRRRVATWRPGDETMVAELSWPTRGATVNSIRVSPDRRSVLVASGYSATLWSLDGSLQAECVGHASVVNTAAFSPDGRWIATASDDMTARIFDRSGDEIAVLRGHADKVQSAEFDTEQRFVVTAAKDRTVRLWRFRSDAPLVLRPPVAVGQPGYALYDAVFDDSGEQVLTVAANGMAFALQPHEQRYRSILHADDRLNSAKRYVNNGEFAPGDASIALTAGADGRAVLWKVDQQNAEAAYVMPCDAAVLRATFCADGDWILTADSLGVVQLWHAVRRPERGFVVTRHEDMATATFRARPGVRPIEFATASLDATVRLMRIEGDSAAPREVLIEKFPAPAPARDVAFTDDGRLVTAHQDGSIRLWDRSSPDERKLVGQHDSVANCVDVHGDLAVSASRDGTARLWRWQERQPALRVYRGHAGVVWSARFSPDGKRVITTSMDGTARIWFVDERELIRTAEARADRIRALSDDERQRYAALLTPGVDDQ